MGRTPLEMDFLLIPEKVHVFCERLARSQVASRSASCLESPRARTTHLACKCMQIEITPLLLPLTARTGFNPGKRVDA